MSLLPCLVAEIAHTSPYTFLNLSTQEIPIYNVLVLKEALIMSVQYVHFPCKGRNNTKIMWLVLDWCYLGTMYKDG